MKFTVYEKGTAYKLFPIYSQDEQSFFTEPNVAGGFSIMIKGGYTSLDVSLISSTLYGISGFNPQNMWKKTKLIYPNAIQASVKVLFDFDVQQGMGIDYATDWDTFFDDKNGVVCIGDPTSFRNSTNIEFTKNTIASILDETLVAVWIKPRFT